MHVLRGREYKAVSVKLEPHFLEASVFLYGSREPVQMEGRNRDPGFHFQWWGHGVVKSRVRGKKREREKPMWKGMKAVMVTEGFQRGNLT